MKIRVHFLTAILLFFSFHLSAQIIPYQDLNGMIWLKDGRSLQGIIRLDDLYKGAFIKTHDTKELAFTASHIDSIHASVPGEDSMYVIVAGKFEGKSVLGAKLQKRNKYNLYERIEVQTYDEHVYNARGGSMHEVRKHNLKSEFYMQSLPSAAWQKFGLSKGSWPKMFSGKEAYAKQVIAGQSKTLTEKESLLGLVNEMNKFAQK